LQAGTSPSAQTVWKLYGPDLNGAYGGDNGTGGLEGVSPYLNTFNPVISDARGNVLAEVTNGVPSWMLARPTGYGAVPGYRPVAYGNGVDLAQSCAFRGREVDVTGYHHFGRRDYDPVSGQWLSYDPAWNEHDPNGYSFCGGDCINGFDSDGRCFEAVGSAAKAGVQDVYNVLYTGQVNPSPDVYDAAVDAAGDYVYDSGGVRGFYGGVGINSKYPGVGSLAGQGGLTGTWTVDSGAGAEVDVGAGLQERGQNSLGIFTSQTVGVGSSYQFWSQDTGFQAPALGSSGNISAPAIYGGTANSQGGANFIIQNQNNAGIGINYGPVYGGLIVNPSLVLQNFVDSYHIITGTH
jgi:RHS repeat-associated protein